MRLAWLRNLAIGWNRYFNKMKLLDYSIEHGYILFTCELVTKANKCSQYFWRPFFCREYPRGFSYFEVPVTLPGCGFKFVQKKKM